MAPYSDRGDCDFGTALAQSSERSALLEVALLLGIALVGRLATFFWGAIMPS